MSQQQDQTHAAMANTIKEWQDNALSKIFNVTLTGILDGTQANPKRRGRYVMESEANAMESEGRVPLIGLDNLNNIIFQGIIDGGPLGGRTPMAYLLECWWRAEEILENLQGERGRALEANVRTLRVETLRSVKDVLAAYIGTLIQEPDALPTDNPHSDPSDEFATTLVEMDDERDHHGGLSEKFIAEFINKWADDPDSLGDIWANILRRVSVKVYQEATDGSEFPGNIYKILGVVMKVMEKPVVAKAVVCNPQFALTNIDKLDRSVARDMEVVTVFGPLLSMSAFPGDNRQIIRKLFSGIDPKNVTDQTYTEKLASSEFSLIRQTVELIQMQYFKFFDMLVRLFKRDTAIRDSFIEFMARALAANVGRNAMRVKPREVAGDGFMDNLAAVMLMFSEPFTSKADEAATKKVDPEWLRYKAYQMDGVGDVWRDMVRICADKENADSWDNAVTGKDAPKISFVSDCYFLTAHALHVGTIASQSNYNKLLRHLADSERALAMHRERGRMPNGLSGPMFDMWISRVESQINVIKLEKVALDAQLLDPTRLRRALQFYRFSMLVLLGLTGTNIRYTELLSVSDSDGAVVELPDEAALQERVSGGYFHILPDFLFEDPIDFVLFMVRHAPHVLYDYRSSGFKDLLSSILPGFIVTFLARPGLIKNPYLKAKLIDILHMLTYRDPSQDDDYVSTLVQVSLEGRLRLHPIISEFCMALDTNPLATKYLIPALFRFYVDIEQTGASSQFYDKFTIRYHIARTLRSLWAARASYVGATCEFFFQGEVGPMKAGTAAAQKASTGTISTDRDIIDKFVARLMSDTTYLLDESLTKLAEIHNLERQEQQQQLTSSEPAGLVAVGGAAPGGSEGQEGGDTESGENAEEARQSRLEEAIHRAQAYVSLAHETIHMLAYLSQLVPRSFLVPEIVERLALMLDYNLVQLAGPKCSQLKVHDMERRFGFRPRILLSELTSIYTNLGLCPAGDEYDNDRDTAMEIENNGSSTGVGAQQSEPRDEDRQRFIDAVAKDERSYRKEVFDKAIGIIVRKGLKTMQDIERLNKFIALVEEAKMSIKADDMAYEDAPEEFLDAVMFTLMEDPVRLPDSGNIVDRATIRAHLLGDPRDPFTRKQLRFEDVEPVPELKKRIEEYKSSKKRQQ
ncbi:Ubiquitin conjugation factor E4 [Spiromyces aspiralis]|uniref:Ubiquitin conjugation factor E4 n=1 Tax=Spiromyces aspiralis TaxID=68401 RepID=A0ACC1I1K5_9FUNG|nr:Ubiquitin conjugation factor E4 [Spiromyces aspiralis]